MPRHAKPPRVDVEYDTSPEACPLPAMPVNCQFPPNPHQAACGCTSPAEHVAMDRLAQILVDVLERQLDEERPDLTREH
jgi:hypothetical protein